MNNDLLCTRRRFLQTASGVFAGAVVWKAQTPFCVSAEGFAPPVAVFSKVYQELKLTFEESAEVTAEAGLDGIDCAVRAGGEILPERAAEDMPRYAEALRKKNVRMLLLTTGITGVSSPHAETLLRTAKRLGVEYYRLGYWSHKTGSLPDKLLQDIRTQLKALASLNGELGVCGLLQNHSASKGSSTVNAGGDLGELYSIVRDFNPTQIGVAFDFGHAIITHGDEWPGHFEKLKPYIKVAYIKDVKRNEGFVRFGDGEFAGSDIFRRLKQMDYHGPLSLHIEFEWPGKGESKTREALVKTLVDSRRALQRWMRAA